MMADKIDDFINHNKLSVQIVGTFTDSSLIRVTVESGGVVGFLPKSIVRQSIKNKTLYKIGELEKLKLSLWAITRKDYKKDGILDGLIKQYTKNQ